MTSGRWRGFLLASICIAGLMAGRAAANAADAWIDTSRLPRVSGAREQFASPATTLIINLDTVEQTAEATGRLLAADGWQAYAQPFAASANQSTMAIMSFKKGPQGLNVFVTVAPAQGNATSVQYTAVALAIDLPFPKDATAIEYSPDRPHLTCFTAGSVEQTLSFFRDELGARGWSLWSAKDGAKQPAAGSAGEITAKGAYAYYVSDNQKPLLLVLQRGDDGRTRVELKSIPVELLVAARREGRPVEAPATETPQAAAARLASEKAAAERSKAVDDMADQILKQAQQITRDAIAEARTGVKTPAAPLPSGGSQASLRPLAGNTAPIPLPETAENIDFDAAEGTLKFTSASSVQALAAFHRAAMKPLGWKEQRSVINRANMVVLAFSKAGKELSLTIMQMGGDVQVSADGSGLITAAAKVEDKPEPTPSAVAANTPAPAAEQNLEAEEMSGLPVPTRHTMSGGERTPFRQGVTASVPVDLTVVLSFYRRELGKRDWKEQAQGAVVKPDQVILAFVTIDGPAVLKLGRENGETTVNLALKKQAEASKAGLLPKPGQAKVMFGNMLPGEAVITINKQTIKVGAGVGAKAPDGPALDLPPGKYKFSFKVAGQPTGSDELTIAADEIWGVLMGPGGALPLQAY